MGSRKIGKYIRLNSSRSGVSASIGVSGMRLSIGTKGIRTHLTVPGTGYTKTNTLVSFKKLLKKKASGKSNQENNRRKEYKNHPSTLPPVHPSDGQLVADELVLIMPKRRTMGRFSKQGKGNRLVNHAIESYTNEQFDEAIVKLKAAKVLLPEDQEISLYLAVLHYLYLEDYAQAVHYFDELDQAMYNEDMKLAIADCLLELQDYDYAQAVLESFEFPDEEEMERLTLLARVHMAKDHLEVAEELLKKAIGRKQKLTPYLMEAKYRIGELYLKMGHYDHAKKNLMAVYMENSSYEEIGRLVEELAMSGSEAE